MNPRDGATRARRTASYRWSFLFGVALVAAAIGNACVESVSNSGLIGAGYRDDDHASVVPAIAGGCVLLLQIAIARVLALLRRGPAPDDGTWFARTATAFSDADPMRDLPTVLIVQFCALYAMEASEQLVRSGHLPVGLAWLGGPILFGVLAHAALGTLCTALFARSMRAIVATLAAIVSVAIRLILAVAPRVASTSSIGRSRRLRPRMQTPYARPFGGRAPPNHATLVLFS